MDPVHQTNRVVRARVHERRSDSRFPYTFTFESGSEHSDSVSTFEELEAVLRAYKVSELEVVFEGDSCRDLTS